MKLVRNVVALSAMTLVLASPALARTVSVASPDGKVVAQISDDDGRLT